MNLCEKLFDMIKSDGWMAKANFLLCPALAHPFSGRVMEIETFGNILSVDCF